MHPRSLGIFAKEPRAGQVISRLAAATSPEFAARVADAFLRDTVARLAHIEARRFLVYSPKEGKEYFSAVVSDHYQLIPQEDGDLGRRLERFIKGQLQAGTQSIVVVGADSPTLPPEFVDQAFFQLQDADVVLGPATDGGYYLLGCRGQSPPILDNISWGSERVLWESIRRMKDSSLRLALLPPWYDVDSVADLWALKGHIAALRKAGMDPKLAWTEKLLEEFS
jgi:rSAM/selenodomain-associated transferase 1